MWAWPHPFHPHSFNHLNSIPYKITANSLLPSPPPLFPASQQQSKASRLSTRSLASKRPRAWTASTRGCLRGETPCLRTPASTLSTRPCPRRPTAQTPRGAPAAAATSSEGPAARRHLGRRGCLAPQPHRDPPPQKRGRGWRCGMEEEKECWNVEGGGIYGS